MDEGHFLQAARYLARSPVTAKLVKKARDWPHASIRGHLKGDDDGLVSVRPLLERIGRFADLLDLSLMEEARRRGLDAKGVIGRPIGSAACITGIERRTE
jgi:putative transposase